MKIDIRDVFWLLATLVLLGLLGLEWRKANSIANEIHELSAAEAPLALVNAQLENAAWFLQSLYRARCHPIDWPALQPLGLQPRTLVTKTIQAETAQQAFEQLFGPAVEVVEDQESSQIFGQPVLRIQPRRTR